MLSSQYEIKNGIAVIPDGEKIIESSLFFFCTDLTSIVIPSSVTKIGKCAFEGCTGLTSIVVSEGNKVYDSRNNCNAIIETSSNRLIKGCQNNAV